MAKLSCVCPCLFGLESVVSHELSQLGAQGLMTENGRVFFEGTPETVARVNVGSRVAGAGRHWCWAGFGPAVSSSCLKE